MFLLTRRVYIANRHPRLSEIGRRNTPKTEKDSGQDGMTKLRHSIAGIVDGKSVLLSSPIVKTSCVAGVKEDTLLVTAEIIYYV